MAQILVVDDEDMLRAMLKQALTKDGHTVLEARNGLEALDVAKQNEIDLIITDLVMPEKNGLDLIMGLKNLKKNAPVLAISGGGGIDSNYDYLSVAKLIGATAVFSKPLDLSAFRSEVEKNLNKT